MNTVEFKFIIPLDKLTEFAEIAERNADIFGAALPHIQNFQKRVFISYRRSDSAYITGRIYDRLVQSFGNGAIFYDVNSLLAGRNFTVGLEQQLAATDLMLVVIGDTWMTTTDAETGERRLENPNDIVRLEVETALDRRIPVIPVLVRNAPFPDRDELPLRMKPLADKSGLAVRPDPDFHPDVDRLIAQIAQTLNVQL